MLQTGKWFLRYTRLAHDGEKEEKKPLTAATGAAALKEASALYADYEASGTRRHSPTDPVANPRLCYEIALKG